MSDFKFRIPEQLLLPWHPRHSLSVARVAEMLECSPDTVTRYIEEGLLKAWRRRQKPGSPYFVLYESVIEFVEKIHAENGIEPRFRRP
jgi:hypothetical protein